MSDKSIERCLGALFVILGLVGVHYKFEYSGWVLFFGILAVVQ